MQKRFEFEEEPYISVTIDLDYTYIHQPARLNGLPENCCPEDTDIEIIPEQDYAERIMAAYVAEARQAIKRFDAKLDEMRNDGTVVGWAKEDQQASLEDLAD